MVLRFSGLLARRPEAWWRRRISQPALGYESRNMHEPPASINLPPWTGTPKEAAEVWQLKKGQRIARCSLWSLGGEVRLEVDGQWVRGETHREGLALIDAALEWKRQFEGKAWK